MLSMLVAFVGYPYVNAFIQENIRTKDLVSTSYRARYYEYWDCLKKSSPNGESCFQSPPEVDAVPQISRYFSDALSITHFTQIGMKHLEGYAKIESQETQSPVLGFFLQDEETATLLCKLVLCDKGQLITAGEKGSQSCTIPDFKLLCSTLQYGDISTELYSIWKTYEPSMDMIDKLEELLRVPLVFREADYTLIHDFKTHIEDTDYSFMKIHVLTSQASERYNHRYNGTIGHHRSIETYDEATTIHIPIEYLSDKFLDNLKSFWVNYGCESTILLDKKYISCFSQSFSSNEMEEILLALSDEMQCKAFLCDNAEGVFRIFFTDRGSLLNDGFKRFGGYVNEEDKDDGYGLDCELFAQVFGLNDDGLKLKEMFYEQSLKFFVTEFPEYMGVYLIEPPLQVTKVIEVYPGGIVRAVLEF